MSAPERVWVDADRLRMGNAEGFAYDPLDVGYIIYVPESALLAAKRERDDLMAIVIGDKVRKPSNPDLAAELSALRAAEAERDVWMRHAEAADAKNQDDATQLANAINVERDKALRQVMEQNEALRAQVAALTAERDEHLKWRTVEQEIGDKQRADLAALREQVRVLTPLARLGLFAMEEAYARERMPVSIEILERAEQLGYYDPDDTDDVFDNMPATTAARAILGRVP